MSSETLSLYFEGCLVNSEEMRPRNSKGRFSTDLYSILERVNCGNVIVFGYEMATKSLMDDVFFLRDEL